MADFIRHSMSSLSIGPRGMVRLPAAVHLLGLSGAAFRYREKGESRDPAEWRRAGAPVLPWQPNGAATPGFALAAPPLAAGLPERLWRGARCGHCQRNQEQGQNAL